MNSRPGMMRLPFLKLVFLSLSQAAMANTPERCADFTFAATNLGLANGANSFTNIAQNVYGLKTTNTLSASLPSSVTLQFDSNGNLTNDGTRSFAYDSENELTNVWVTGQWKTEFVYDGFGRRRIEKDYGWSGTWVKTNETRLIYDWLLIVQERDSNNVVQVSYSRGLDLSGSRGGAGGIGGLLGRTDTNGTTYYHADGAGNITSLADGNENIAARYLYGAFGKLTGKWGPLADANAMQFSSMATHGRSGMSLYPFRAYEPNLQRWMTRDPIGEAGGINQYGFVANTPLASVDPDGQRTFLDLINPISHNPASDYLHDKLNQAENYLKDSAGLLGQALYDTMMGERGEGRYDPNMKGSLDAAEGIVVIDRDDNVLRNSLEEGGRLVAGAVIDGGEMYLLNKAFGCRVKPLRKSPKLPGTMGPAQGEQMLYRGVPGNGTEKAILAEQGIAIPRGTALDEASLIKHVLGEDVDAGVTSWTTDRNVAAQRFAGPNGTVIEVPRSQVESQIVPRPNVPRYGSESEVLLKGTVQGTPTKP